MSVPTQALLLPARSTGEMNAARALFRAYAATLNIDLGFQGFEEEGTVFRALSSKLASGRAVTCGRVFPSHEEKRLKRSAATVAAVLDDHCPIDQETPHG